MVRRSGPRVPVPDAAPPHAADIAAAPRRTQAKAEDRVHWLTGREVYRK
jgi:hypothetical protein